MPVEALHRREIQGLRAVAVLAVIFNHTFTKYFPGGFIGVDIFFVISGYLITQQLTVLSTRERGLRALLIFYSRRIKRILPSALLVIWVTIWLSYKYLGPVVGNDTMRDGRWASLFFANQHFNQLKIDYFAQGIPAPLLQHYWSLAVEEQFYLFWPMILIAITYISKSAANRILISLLTFATSLSFISIFITESVSRYFSSTSRIWELTLGAMLALIKIPKVSPILSWLGVISVFSSIFLLNSNSKVPGVVILPTLIGSGLLIAQSPPIVKRLLSSKIPHYIGNISFLLYLWHWPIIELHKQLSYSDLSATSFSFLILITFFLSMITHHLFEKPIRYNAFLTERINLTNLSGLASIAISVIATYKMMKG